MFRWRHDELLQKVYIRWLLWYIGCWKVDTGILGWIPQCPKLG